MLLKKERDRVGRPDETNETTLPLHATGLKRAQHTMQVRPDPAHMPDAVLPFPRRCALLGGACAFPAGWLLFS